MCAIMLQFPYRIVKNKMHITHQIHIVHLIKNPQPEKARGT
jgi:hypothetical protein